MTYRVVITKKASKAIAGLMPKQADRITTAIHALADDPRPAGCKKLAGNDQWRIRIGDFRVLYTIADDELIVSVVRVGNRREVYR